MGHLAWLLVERDGTIILEQGMYAIRVNANSQTAETRGWGYANERYHTHV